MADYAFFPGCVLSQAAEEAKMALDAIAPRLDMHLHEIPGWSCCGATHVQDIDPTTALIANARNIALAEQMEMPILTACSTCLMVMRRSKKALDAGEKVRINRYLVKGELAYNGTAKITFLLWELAKNLKKLAPQVKKSLKDIKVACFYGCHTVRPEDALGFESSFNPTSFEKVVKTLGCQVVPFAKRLDCCGFHAIYSAEKSAHKMIAQIVTAAKESKASCVVTPCPLCQMQLDLYQESVMEQAKLPGNMPILHLPQLVGLAMGFDNDTLGLDRNMIDASKLVALNSEEQNKLLAYAEQNTLSA